MHLCNIRKLGEKKLQPAEYKHNQRDQKLCVEYNNYVHINKAKKTAFLKVTTKFKQNQRNLKRKH
jgi:hypothetical protein